jgi:hypothetical protein
MKPVLHLNLIRKFFDIIGDPKIDEYRACSEHWNRVFINGSIKIKGKFYHPSDVIVCFSNGYAKNRPQKKFEIKSVSVGTGREEWGAIPGEQYFVIGLGKRMDF